LDTDVGPGRYGGLGAAEHAGRRQRGDGAADLERSGAWQVGLAYGRVARMVDLDGAEAKLRGDAYDVALGFSPTPWLLLYGQAGGSQAQLDGLQSVESATGAGGLLGARANLWQLYEGLQLTAWRVTLGSWPGSMHTAPPTTMAPASCAGARRWSCCRWTTT
jgi:hypothetical protein